MKMAMQAGMPVFHEVGMEGGSNMKQNDGLEGRIVVGRSFAESEIPDKAETGTVLDYLWDGQQGSVFEPVEAAFVSHPDPQSQPAQNAHPAGEDAQSPARPCLDSALRSYSNWLDSIGSN